MRIKLADRKLPDYTRGEEIFNMVTRRGRVFHCRPGAVRD